MKSLFDFIVEPYGQRYNNKVKVGDKSLIINTQVETFKSVNNIAKVLPNETGKPTETHFVYPASLKTNARLIAFRNFIFSKVNEWKF